MEYYQTIQNRAGQTVAVINRHLAGLQVGTTTIAELLAQSQGLNDLAQDRETASVAFDGANNDENSGFLLLRKYTLQLPAVAEGELDDALPAESDLLALLDPVYSVTPRNTEYAIKRGHKLVSALTGINTFLAAQVSPRSPITSGGKGIAELVAALAAQPGLEQVVQDKATLLKQARQTLANRARDVDRLNKRFYKKLEAEARDNPSLAEAMGQIVTESANLPGTLGIRSILQGGDDQLHILVQYENGTGDSSTANTIEWRIDGVDTDFNHTQPASPAGSALGPFAVGQTIKLRTRTRNANGTTTGSLRSLTLLAPV